MCGKSFFLLLACAGIALPVLLLPERLVVRGLEVIDRLHNVDYVDGIADDVDDSRPR